ncbi:MAG TPA: PAS domain-containing protein [Pyrinomonadaceae bacterium]|nr:PAS domain-containing protein [Pyrinomonadaceae bacterium]
MIDLPYLADRNDRATAVKEIVYTLDLSGYFKFVNATGQRLTGYSSEELVAMNVAEMVGPELADLARQQIACAVEQLVGAVYEIEIIAKNRRRIALETSFHLVMRHGRPVEIHGIAVPPIGTWWGPRARCVDTDFRNVMIAQS